MTAFDPKRTFLHHELSAISCMPRAGNLLVQVTINLRLVMMFVVALVSTSCAFDNARDLRREYANKVCEDNHPLQTTGYLVSSAVLNRFWQFRDLRESPVGGTMELVYGKYSFIEFEQGAGRYERIYLTSVGSEACARLDKQVWRPGRWMVQVPAIPPALPVNVCVGFESTNKASSRYLIDVDWIRDGGPPNSAGGGWGPQFRLFIQDRISSKTVAEFLYTDTVHAGRRAADFTCPRSTGDIVDGWLRRALQGMPNP